MQRPKVAILGLGEAGSHFANDLAEMGFQVHGWDPNPVKTLHTKVHFAKSNMDAVSQADVIFNVNLSSVAAHVASEVKDNVQPHALFCEMNTSSPHEKIEIEKILDGQCHVLDIGIMAPVPKKGIHTPLIASGLKAESLKEMFPKLENISVVKGNVGEAAKLKLLRSIVYKGVAAVICEAVEAGEHFDKSEYIRNQIESIIGQNEGLIDRFVEGSKTHARRRSHEMEAVSAMLSNEGLEDHMSAAAFEKLTKYSLAKLNN